ncbi:MAG: TonB-dependent receptor, partial [Acidobacteriota bacterium]|nr:TonB-dependent receptor [Acidobacteriota bacterium]
YDLGNRNLAFMYEGASSGKLFDWAARYSFGRNRQEYDSSNTSWPEPLATRDLDNKSFNAQAGYNGNILSLDGGMDYLKYELNDDGYKGDISDTGVYFSGRLRLLNERFIISGGGRYDHFSVSYANDSAEGNFAPSVGAAVLPLEWLKFRVNYAAGFRMPDPVEYGGGHYYAANKDIKPEKSKTIEFGSDINYKSFDAGATWFHTDWDDKIIAQKVPELGGRWQYLNITKSVISGLELAAGKNIGAAWNLVLRPYVNLTLLTERKNGDDALAALVGSDILPNTPKTLLAYGLDFRHKAYDFAVNANAVYSSDSLSRDWRDDSSPTYGTYIWNGAGTVLNMSVEKGLYNWKENGSLKLRAEIRNIFDADNMPYLDYPGPGRNFYVGLRYGF